MQLEYLRIDLFYLLLRPFSARARRRRTRTLTTIMKLHPGMSILDLGGQPAIWDDVPFELNLTILNLPRAATISYPSRHHIKYVEGDACKIEGIDAKSFDAVFSNSVIEHVGPPDKQAEFAGEVRRFGKPYWIQTPCIWFPIEAHCGMPFWWFYPAFLRRHLIERWRKKLPHWTEMVEGTTILKKSDLKRLFPEATILTEKIFGIPKSYIACLDRAYIKTQKP
jgi:Methyltransferase domain